MANFERCATAQTQFYKWNNNVDWQLITTSNLSKEQIRRNLTQMKILNKYQSSMDGNLLCMGERAATEYLDKKAKKEIVAHIPQSYLIFDFFFEPMIFWMTFSKLCGESLLSNPTITVGLKRKRKTIFTFKKRNLMVWGLIVPALSDFMLIAIFFKPPQIRATGFWFASFKLASFRSYHLQNLNDMATVFKTCWHKQDKILLSWL